MSSSKQDELARERAHQAFLKEERVHERATAKEEQRHQDMLAKTEWLRKLRLAREAAEAATAKAKLIKKPGPRTGGK